MVQTDGGKFYVAVIEWRDKYMPDGYFETTEYKTDDPAGDKSFEDFLAKHGFTEKSGNNECIYTVRMSREFDSHDAMWEYRMNALKKALGEIKLNEFDLFERCYEQYRNEYICVIKEQHPELIQITSRQEMTAELEYLYEAIEDDLLDKGFSENEIKDIWKMDVSSDTALRFSAYQIGLEEDYTTLKELQSVMGKDFVNVKSEVLTALVDIYKDFSENTHQFLPTDRDKDEEEIEK